MIPLETEIGFNWFGDLIIFTRKYWALLYTINVVHYRPLSPIFISIFLNCFRLLTCVIKWICTVQYIVNLSNSSHSNLLKEVQPVDLPNPSGKQK